MNITKQKCSHCGNLNYIVPSNNPLVEGICIKCLNEKLDASRVEHFEFFCRTYNLPFNPNTYMTLYKKYQNTVFLEYVNSLVNDGKIRFDEPTGDLWKEVEKEWAKVKTYSEMMLKIPTLRESFEERAKVKWGLEYTFGELIQLENLLINTIKVYNITDPMRLDAIKKACKLSVKIDALIESGDAKSIKDYTAAYQSFLKAAQIEELGQVANEGTVKTVADLYKYLEKNGFEFTFYDHEERDIVDRTINDIKKSIKLEIENATGLDLKIAEIKKSFRQKEEDDASDEAIAESPLNQLISEDYYEELEMETDQRLAEEELDLNYDDE